MLWDVDFLEIKFVYYSVISKQNILKLFFKYFLMHELSIAQSIIDIVTQHLPDDNHAHVKSVIVRIGKLSNVLPDSLNFCFEAITKDTNFEKTELVIKIIPITIECKQCGKVSEIESYTFLCPSCESTNISVISGNDLNVEEIELE